METAIEKLPDPIRMRANRRVVEEQCGICDRVFEFAEEVYSCPSCGGHHHVACWDANLSCSASTPETNGGEESTLVTVPAAATPVPAALAPDERRCPSCSEVIKQEALKCRFCGQAFDSALVAQIAPEQMPSDLATKVEKLANDSLAYALVGFICAPPILGVVAISKGNQALRILVDYPHYASRSSVRGKARAGIVLGSVALIIFAIGMIAQLAGV